MIISCKPFVCALLLAGLGASVSGVAHSADYYRVVPLQSSSPNDGATEVRLDLQAGALPKATAGHSFSYDLTPHLRIVGDQKARPGDAQWTANEQLPPGLALSPSGLLSGTPSLKSSTPTSFTVTAGFRDKTAEQAFSLEVLGQPLRAVNVGVGPMHACAITPESTVWCWGRGAQGQLGNGTKITSTSEPVQVVGLVGATALAMSQGNTCAIASGALHCWGFRVAQGGTAEALTPHRVASSGVTDVTASEGDICYVQNGSAKCFAGSFGGDGTKQIPGLESGVTSIAAGNYHFCAVQSGSVKCWGEGRKGELGDGRSENSVDPVQVVGLPSGISQVAAGPTASCAHSPAGAWCWGQNLQFNLGLGDVTGDNWGNVTTAHLVVGGAGTSSIAMGRTRTCFLQSSTVKCAGESQHEGIGLPPRSGFVRVMEVVPGLESGVTAVAAKANATCVVHEGFAKCFGKNVQGLLGDGSTIDRFTPEPVRR